MYIYSFWIKHQDPPKNAGKFHPLQSGKCAWKFARDERGGDGYGWEGGGGGLLAGGNLPFVRRNRN